MYLKRILVFRKKRPVASPQVLNSNYSPESMHWIREVEMATSVDDLQTSRSIFGKLFPNFETLDAKIASSLKEIIQNSHFRKRVYWEEQKVQIYDRKTDRFCDL